MKAERTALIAAATLGFVFTCLLGLGCSSSNVRPLANDGDLETHEAEVADTDAPDTEINDTESKDSDSSEAESNDREIADSEATETDTGETDNDTTAVFLAGELLARPTATSITISVVPRSALDVYVEYGIASGTYSKQTVMTSAKAQEPLAIDIVNLDADKDYVYRLRWRSSGDASFSAAPERRFHTARPKGKPFVFTIQADPHLDDRSDLELYHRTLANELADTPDFMLDLGDTFMCEKHSAPFTATIQPATDKATVISRYLYERGNFGFVAHSTPLFLVNGNHEGEAGWLGNGTADSLAVWTTLARKTYFPPPLVDGFFSGSTTEEPFVGQRGAYYAWEWGDALFVVLDPYWYSTSKSKLDAWVWTLGQTQYLWLAETLTKSNAAFRFVFIHNLVGGLDGLGRGGIEAAPFYEWGGQNEDGSPGFETKRPGWGKPIHQVLVENHVTAVFHGHDHVYVRQTLDGIIYQELPQPSVVNFNGGPGLAEKQHYASGVIQSSSGHLRVTVGSGETKVEYVRAYRPQDENGQVRNGDISDTYTLLPR